MKTSVTSEFNVFVYLDDGSKEAPVRLHGDLLFALVGVSAAELLRLAKSDKAAAVEKQQALSRVLRRLEGMFILEEESVAADVGYCAKRVSSIAAEESHRLVDFVRGTVSDMLL
jgi:hypothetical protein